MDATSPTALRCGLSATFHRLLGLGVLLAVAGFETLTVADDREYEPVRRLAPAIRAELCALPETPVATRAWLCPASLAGSAAHAAADVR